MKIKSDLQAWLIVNNLSWPVGNSKVNIRYGDVTVLLVVYVIKYLGYLDAM